MKRVIPLLLVLASWTSAAFGATYRSPDSALQAKVLMPGLGHENRVSIQDIHEAVKAEADYTSDDGEHGLVVDRAAWSPDSQFFVFSTSSSGGHQAWQCATFFFDRHDGKIHDLAEFLPPIADPDFKIRAPSILTVAVWTPFRKNGIVDSIILSISFNLRDLRRRPPEPSAP